jgi:hypothetical protein
LLKGHDDYQQKIVALDENWFYYFGLETEWRHAASPKKKTRSIPSAGKV